MKNQENGNLNTQIERCFVIKITASHKMQKIIKQRNPSRQLFEIVNFAFMKIFVSLVKIAILGHTSFFVEICIMHYCPNQTLDLGRTPWCKSLRKRRNTLKMAFLSKESKIFIKAKLTVSKSFQLGLLDFIIFCILRDALLKSYITYFNLSFEVAISIGFS